MPQGNLEAPRDRKDVSYILNPPAQFFPFFLVLFCRANVLEYPRDAREDLRGERAAAPPPRVLRGLSDVGGAGNPRGP